MGERLLLGKIEELLTRGIVNIIPGKIELESALRSGKKLNVYLGIDPTATRIHLGHAVNLRKLQAFIELGHHVTFLIGDFTARVGDNSDKESERPLLTKQEIEANFQTYKEQAEKILDFSKAELHYNSEWLSPLSFADVLQLCQQFSLNDYLSREIMKKKMETGVSIRLDEVLYPIMQGYDSFHMDTDVQIGAADQTFNMQAGRVLQKRLHNKESFILVNDYLIGTDGRKMSKSWGNAVWLSDSPEEMFGKIMSLKDELIEQYFILGTSTDLKEIGAVRDRLIKGENPMVLKKELACAVVTEFHGKIAAHDAQEQFEKQFQEKTTQGVNIPEVCFDKHERGLYLRDEFLVKMGLASSKSEARIFILKGGTISSAAEKLTGPNNSVSIRLATFPDDTHYPQDDGDVFKVGRKIRKVRLK
ncbi:MAG: Tyrosine-tRNA ligase [Parcubacteria group bacterium GW2011_GWF2_46_8]|nr:MAG: Tyrosine-tRNA ligase [Parcubacteria group bacterium GW2011_GWF1_45_5]KKU47418.1 MAG: Tyrosine-tRNA ligase [Parcubacteria group bacterium GW2011_GWF2_46_8]